MSLQDDIFDIQDSIERYEPELSPAFKRLYRAFCELEGDAITNAQSISAKDAAIVAGAETIHKLKAENQALRERLAEAEKVIEPFAEYGLAMSSSYEDKPDDLGYIAFGAAEGEYVLTVGHLRAAAKWKEG